MQAIVLAKTLAERVYFTLCVALGRLLRSGRYSTVRIVDDGGDGGDGARLVRKHRLFYAPLLIWLGEPLMGILDTGVRVLPQREWEERERSIYSCLYGASIQIDHVDHVDRVDRGDGCRTLILPRLPGETLAALLEDRELPERMRKAAIERAVVALGEFHGCGLTHGDAMAGNVLVDLDAGVARWFDFETIHDAHRPMTWRRADDLRALLMTCVARTALEKRAETLRFILDVYADQEMTRLLAAFFTPLCRRPLTFHLAQAEVSLRCWREIARLLEARSGE